MKFKGLVVFVVVSMVFGCMPKYPEVPGNVIGPDKFSDILFDLRLAEANRKVLQHSGIRIENLTDSSYHLVYEMHQVTPEEVRRSYDFYTHEPVWMDKFSAEILDRLNQMEP